MRLKNLSLSGFVTLASMVLGAIVLVVWVCGWCWDYTISSWLVYAGKVDTFPLWLGVVISFIPGLGQLSVPAAVITKVLLLFLG